MILLEHRGIRPCTLLYNVIMGKRDALTKILAVGGTVLVWLPILAPVIFSLIHLLNSKRLLFDYLMPAELFPVILIGGAALLWSSLRAHTGRGWIGGSLAAAVGGLLASQILAVLTGLASGAREPAGLSWTVVLAMLAVYSLAVIVLGIAGVLLLRQVFLQSRPQPANP